MFRLDMDLIRHALQTASDRGFASVEIGLGEDTFQATFQPRKSKPRAEVAHSREIPEELPTKSITAPSVGYFQPGLVLLEIGQVVKTGDIVGEIFALGLKSEVVAKWEGTVVEVFATADQPVEYGQALALLRIKVD